MLSFFQPFLRDFCAKPLEKYFTEDAVPQSSITVRAEALAQLTVPNTSLQMCHFSTFHGFAVVWSVTSVLPPPRRKDECLEHSVKKTFIKL